MRMGLGDINNKHKKKKKKEKNETYSIKEGV